MSTKQSDVEKLRRALEGSKNERSDDEKLPEYVPIPKSADGVVATPVKRPGKKKRVQ